MSYKYNEAWEIQKDVKEVTGTYIIFRFVEKKMKTENWSVENKKSGATLGIIEWYFSWRQYCFFPTEDDLVFSHKCLDEIVKFLISLKQRKMVQEKLREVKQYEGKVATHRA